MHPSVCSYHVSFLFITCWIVKKFWCYLQALSYWQSLVLNHSMTFSDTVKYSEGYVPCFIWLSVTPLFELFTLRMISEVIHLSVTPLLLLENLKNNFHILMKFFKLFHIDKFLLDIIWGHFARSFLRVIAPSVHNTFIFCMVTRKII